MRCDANVSVRPIGQEAFGEHTEIKNINSFRFVEQAIEHEIARQIDVLESGGRIERETRLYDPDKDETRSMRGKELGNDYRYFPDPDLMPLTISDAFVERIRDTLPELPDAMRRYIEEWVCPRAMPRLSAATLNRPTILMRRSRLKPTPNSAQTGSWVSYWRTRRNWMFLTRMPGDTTLARPTHCKN